MSNVFSNLQWKCIEWDPMLFDWSDSPEPVPPEWTVPGIVLDAFDGVNTATKVYYTSPNYRYETRPAIGGPLMHITADHFDTYMAKASRADIMAVYEFANGARLTIKTRSSGISLLQWVLTLGELTLSSATIMQSTVHSELLKLPRGTMHVALTYFLDYSYSLDTTTPRNNFGWIGEGMVGPRWEDSKFPLLFTSLTEPNSELFYNILDGAEVNQEVGPENLPDGPNDADFGYVDVNIDFPDLPTTDGLSTGLFSLYKLDSGKVNSLAGQLWSNDFATNILKNYDSPLENLISLNILPLDITGTDAEIMIGNYATSLVAKKITGQFVDLDGGSVEVPKIFGHQFDFKPASSCQVYIPYIGYKDIDLDDVVGGTLHLKYRVDLLTGNILAMIRVALSERYTHDSVEYYFNGNCATSLPLSGANYMGYYSRMIGQAGNAMGIMGGGIGGAAMAAGGVSSMLQNKPDYHRSGNLSGCAGFMGPQTAFLLLSSPKSGIAGNLQAEKGLVSNIYSEFANLSGYNEIYVFHPTADLVKECTEEEMIEIENLLKGGVFF